jgi:hypothetical protein
MEPRPRANTILVVIFSLLMLVLVGELIYFFYSQYNKLPFNNQNSAVPTLNLSLTPTLTTSRPKNALVGQTDLSFLSNLTKNPNQKLTIKMENDGFVGTIDERQNDFILKIVDGNGNKLEGFVINKQPNSKNPLRYYLVQGNKQTEISSFNDVKVKVGDKIQVIHEENINDDTTSFTLYVYR